MSKKLPRPGQPPGLALPTKHMKPDWEVSSPRRLLTYGREYVNASAVLAEHKSGGLPELALACMGIELILKAYLRHAGKSDAELRNDIKHDLSLALGLGLENGLDSVVKLTAAERKPIARVNQLYRDRILHYAPNVRVKIPFATVAAAIRATANKLYHALSVHFDAVDRSQPVDALRPT